MNRNDEQDIIDVNQTSSNTDENKLESFFKNPGSVIHIIDFESFNIVDILKLGMVEYHSNGDTIYNPNFLILKNGDKWYLKMNQSLQETYFVHPLANDINEMSLKNADLRFKLNPNKIMKLSNKSEWFILDRPIAEPYQKWDDKYKYYVERQVKENGSIIWFGCAINWKKELNGNWTELATNENAKPLEEYLPEIVFGEDLTYWKECEIPIYETLYLELKDKEFINENFKNSYFHNIIRFIKIIFKTIKNKLK